MPKIEITLTAQTIPDNYSADLSIIIDVLRASSVIVTALAHQTPYIIPADSIDQARLYQTIHPHAILAGERGGTKINGFAKGNSPYEHMNPSSKNPIILTTSNGTLALKRCQKSKHIIIASFLNVDAACERISTSNYEHIHIACAGTNGEFSLDDFLMAGAIIARLDKNIFSVDDLGIAANQLYNSARKNIHSSLIKTKHYNKLIALGFQRDLEYCLTENKYSFVPEVNHEHPQIITVRQIV